MRVDVLVITGKKLMEAFQKGVWGSVEFDPKTFLCQLATLSFFTVGRVPTVKRIVGGSEIPPVVSPTHIQFHPRPLLSASQERIC